LAIYSTPSFVPGQCQVVGGEGLQMASF